MYYVLALTLLSISSNFNSQFIQHFSIFFPSLFSVSPMPAFFRISMILEAYIDAHGTPTGLKLYARAPEAMIFCTYITEITTSSTHVCEITFSLFELSVGNFIQRLFRLDLAERISQGSGRVEEIYRPVS